MNITLLIGTLTTLVAGTLLLKIYFSGVKPQVWLLGPILGIVLFTFATTGIISNSIEPTSVPGGRSSSVITVDLISPAVMVSNIVHQGLGEGIRGEIPKVQGIDVRQSEDGYFVTVRFAIDANSSAGLIKDSAQMDVYSVARALYQSGAPIAYVKMVGTFPLEDPYGFMRETEVLKCSLTSTTAQKINWSSIRHADLFDLFDSVWWHSSIRTE